mgnify:FL=1
MDGMVINNLSAQVTTECGLLQQELLKSFVEARKQRGIMESLMQRLAAKKMNAIRDMYENVRVTHKKFGECGSDFYESRESYIFSRRIEIPKDEEQIKAIELEYRKRIIIHRIHNLNLNDYPLEVLEKVYIELGGN